jgi:hypothetical protein
VEDFDEERERDEGGERCRCCRRGPPVRRMRRGDTLSFSFQVRRRPTFDQDSQLEYCAHCDPSAVQVNVAGWFFWATLKRTVSDPDQLAVAQVTSQPSSAPAGGGISVVSAAAGQGTVTVPAIATRAFPDGVVRLVYDVQGQDTSGQIWTVETGTVVVRPDVTSSIAAYPGGGSFPPAPVAPVPVVTSANSPYALAPVDSLVEFDESNGFGARALLPPNPMIGESHTFVWPKWTLSSPPPVIDGNGKQLTPYSQISQSSGALVSTTAITDFDGRVTYRFDGAAWALAGG